jgi:hypothetical protein
MVGFIFFGTVRMLATIRVRLQIVNDARKVKYEYGHQANQSGWQ